MNKEKNGKSFKWHWSLLFREVLKRYEANMLKVINLSQIRVMIDVY